MNTQKIAAVIVTYNPDLRILKNVNAIKSQVQKVIIVDNSANEESYKILESISLQNEHIKIIYNHDNIGIASAFNIGIKSVESEFDWIVTLDQDSIADCNMVENMLNAWMGLSSTEREETLSLFPNFIDAKVMNLDFLDTEQPNKYVDAEITSGNMIKIEAFKNIGYFDESLFIDMVDTDFCMRLFEKGIKMMKVKTAILYHSLGEAERVKKGFVSFNTTNHSPLRRYYMTRNRLYTWKKYSHLDSFTLKRDKKLFWKEFVKIILGEEQKREKMKMIFRGYMDYKKGVRGKFEKRGR